GSGRLVTGIRERAVKLGLSLILAALVRPSMAAHARAGQASVARSTVGVGAQYDSTHVYVAPGDLDAFVKSFATTFGGQPSKRIVTNVLPVPSMTEFQYLWTPVGTLSVFAFRTPIPFPFGQ